MVFGAERRRHHAARGVVPIFVEILGLIQRQELHQRLTIDAHAFLACAADGFMGLLARDMHDIERHACGVSDGDRPVGSFAFQLWWAGIGVAFGPGDAFVEVFLLQLGHQIAVFGVHHRQRAQLSAALEGGEHLIVLDHQRALVGHEVLERVDAHIDGILHLVKHILIPAGDGHVIADVRTDLRGRFAVPFVDRVLDGAISTGQTEIHHHRGAATGRSPGAGLKGLSSCRAHKGHLKMCVRVNTAGDDISAFGVDVFVTLQILTDLNDLLALDQHIRFPGPVRRANLPTFDHLAHAFSPVFICQISISAQACGPLRGSRLSARTHTDPKHPNAGPCTPMSKGPKSLSTQSEK